jgi:hypothetical protein
VVLVAFIGGVNIVIGEISHKTLYFQLLHYPSNVSENKFIVCIKAKTKVFEFL